MANATNQREGMSAEQAVGAIIAAIVIGASIAAAAALLAGLEE